MTANVSELTADNFILSLEPLARPQAVIRSASGRGQDVSDRGHLFKKLKPKNFEKLWPKY